MSGKLRSRDRSWKFPGISIGAVLGLALISAIATAQTTKPTPQIRVATRLIQVSVIVRDKKGDPVTGLTRDDFVLLDQGEPQKVAFFSEETDHSGQPPAAPAAPNVFSNQSQTRSGAPVSVTVILLDSLNTGRPNQQIADAVAAPLESSELGLTVQADAAEASGARKLRVHVRVNSSRMLFQQKDGRWIGRLDLVWAQLGSGGQSLGSNSETLNLHMSPETYATTERDGLKISTTLDIRDDAGALRLVARDAGTGAIGSLDIPLDKIFPKPKTPATAHP